MNYERSSYPRRRVSSDQGVLIALWIPAFAGMTSGVLGMTSSVLGMTRVLGMTSGLLGMTSEIVIM